MSETPRRFCPTCGGEYDADRENCPEDGTTLRDLDIVDGEDAYLVGETLDDRFLLQEKFGEGAMGFVYLADQLSIDRQVAIKVLKPQIADNEVVIKRFYREAQVISQIQHPNVVNLFDFGRDDRGLLYLVMELIEGIGVDELLSGGASATANFALETAKQCCAGLAQIHSEGVIHRDVKPENLMLVPLADGRVQLKVVDFGIALAGRNQNASLTKSGTPLGTSYYMAPEQAGGANVTEAVDIYALGVVLYEMVAGRAPFTGDSPMRVLQKHIDDPPDPLETWIPDGEVPEALVETVEQMLAKAPEDRPGDAAQLRARFAEIQGELDEGPMSVAPEGWPEALEESYVRGAGTRRPGSDDEQAGDAASESGAVDGVDASGARAKASSAGSRETFVTEGGTERARTGGSGGGRARPPVAAPASAPTATSATDDNIFWMVIGSGLLFVVLGSAAIYWITGPSILEVFGVEVAEQTATSQKSVTLQASEDPVVVYRGDERLGETPLTVEIEEPTAFRIERGDLTGTVEVTPSSPEVLDVGLRPSGGADAEAPGG